MGQPLPDNGVNFSGEWYKGKKDAKGKPITASHKNARYTVSLCGAGQPRPRARQPGRRAGRRRSSTAAATATRWVPVEQAFDWTDGIIAKGASLESETTAAIIGQDGVADVQPDDATIDFVSIPLGKYIQNNLDFAKGVKKAAAGLLRQLLPSGTKNGKYLNGMLDKTVWLLWAELRVNGDVDAIKTPTGFIPFYEDLAPLFQAKLNKNYTEEQYVKAFSIRVPNLLAKYDRVEQIYRTKVDDTPAIVYETFANIRKRLNDAQARFGDIIAPNTLADPGRFVFESR